MEISQKEVEEEEERGTLGSAVLWKGRSGCMVEPHNS